MTMNHSLAAVASRIQERNNALRAELASLELLRSQHAQAEERLRAEERAFADARKALLTAVRARHAAELERRRDDDAARDLAAAAARLREDAAAGRARTADLAARFDRDHAPTYAAHDLSTALFARRAEARLVAAQSRKRRREERLLDLAERTARQRREAEEAQATAARVREEREALDRGEGEDDEETVALNMQIKSVLAQVRGEGIFRQRSRFNCQFLSLFPVRKHPCVQR